jgi:TatD DNase family protein
MDAGFSSRSLNILTQELRLIFARMLKANLSKNLKKMIDSHAHLIWDSYENDIEEVMQRAQSKGIEAFIHSCVHTEDMPKMVELQKKYPQIHLSAGVHPCDANKWEDKCESEIRKYAKQIVAIGETGLDYYHKDSPVDLQKEVFRKHCKLAKEFELAMIIHCRDAFEDTLQILSEENPGKGVMHCYTGTADFSAKFWELGFYTSFSGCLTYKSAQNLRDEAKKIPLERCLIETDCPFLAPQGQRGKRNEPSFMPETAEVLASVHSVSVADVDRITTANTKKLFSLN